MKIARKPNVEALWRKRDEIVAVFWDWDKMKPVPGSDADRALLYSRYLWLVIVRAEREDVS